MTGGPMYDVIIIGGGVAGYTAGIYLSRAGKKALVIEGTAIGGQISVSPKVENYPGFKEISGMELSDLIYTQATDLGVETEFDTVTGVEDLGTVKKVTTDYSSFEAKAVIIATGCRHRKLGAKGEEEFAGKGVSYCAICDGAFYSGKEVAVVGGGSSALSACELLSGICSKVSLIHRRQEFRGELKLVETLVSKPNVEFILDSVVDEITGGGSVSGISVKNTVSGEVKSIPVSAVFVSVGQEPQNAIFSSLVDLDAQGYIDAGEDSKTSRAGFFAAGDCRSKMIRQLTTAVADGTSAAMAACEYLRLN